MAVPHAVLAGGWIPFLVVTLLAFLFAWIYIRYFQHHELSEVSSTLCAVFGLFIALLTSALVPVDVFLISYMKDSSGNFKSWAKDLQSRESIQNTVIYAYYALYGLVGLLVFFVLPFMYFYYEEKDDESSKKERCCSSLKYTAVFVLVAAVLLVVGAVVPLKHPPRNMTRIDDKLNFLKTELESYSNAEKTMSIFIGCLSMLGMIALSIYMGFGLAALPVGMIRTFNCSKDQEEVDGNGLSKKERDEERGRRLRAKANSGRTLTRWEKNELKRIDEEERLRNRIENSERKSKNSIIGKLCVALKPFEFVLGIIIFLVSTLILISLIISNVDKALHSKYEYGYSLPKPQLLNPLNSVMVYAQKVFPLDYVIFGCMTLLFVLASMSGLQKIGICLCCIRLYRLRPHRTLPQALLFMIFLLMLVILAMNALFLSVTPQYVTFGDQKYMANTTVIINGTHTFKLESKTCSAEAPSALCLTSGLATLFNKLFYRAWFFGAFYYWSGWLLIGVFLVGLLFSCCRRKAPHEERDMDDDGSDDEPLVI